MNVLYENIKKTADNSSAAESDFCISVSAKQPYLKDHDVGLPLFGTVLSLEAMAEAYLLADSSDISFSAAKPSRITCIQNVISGKDCLFSKDSENELICKVSENGTSLYCKNELLFKCMLSSKEIAPQKIALPADISLLSGAVQKDIYQALFHGPSFQVLKKAAKFQNFILAEMNPELPPLSANPQHNAVLPIRIIEFCLQSCGIWELAFSNCVSVPLSIEQIRIHHDFSGGPVYAIAEMKENGGHITALDADCNVYVEVIGYKTKQMPYEGGNYDCLLKKFTN